MINAPDKKQAKILIVEDSEIARVSLSLMLQSLGYTKPDMASSGEMAVNMVVEITYDVILMDIGLPGIDGIEATIQIRQIPKNSKAIIIATTGHAKDTYEQQCFAAGMKEVIAKPFNKNELKRVLDKYTFKK